MVTNAIYIIERSSKLKSVAYFLAGAWLGMFFTNVFYDESRSKE